MRIYFPDSCASILQEDITEDSESLTILIEDIDDFPNTPFPISIGSELIRVNTVEGNVFSDLVRGFKGTTPEPHTVGEMIVGTFTASSFNDMWDDVELRVLRTGDTMEGNIDFNNHEIQNAKLIDCEGFVRIYVDDNPDPENYEEGDIILVPLI